MDAYVDTSALAKWYLNEARSEEFVAWIRDAAPAAISSLTVLEMRSLLARRRREGDLTSEQESRIFAVFEDDISMGHLSRYEIDDDAYQGAARLIEALPREPVRSLDALHLVAARQIRVTTVATADRVMASAAEAMGFAVARFDCRPD